MKSLLVVCLAACPLLAADAGLLQYVAPDAKQVAGIYVDRAVSSPLGTFLQSLAGPDNRDLRGFIEASGFDPRRDLREVVLISAGGTSSGKRGLGSQGLVVARGDFQPEKIGTAAAGSGAVKQSYNGVDLYSGPKRDTWIAFPEASVALFGDEAQVKAALDRRGKSPAIDEQLSAKIGAASTRFDVWFAAKGEPSMRFGKARLPEGALQIVSGGVTLGSVVQLNAEAVMRSEQEARSVVDLLKFLSGIAQMQQRQNPEMAKLFSLLLSADTRVEGSTVLFSASAPEADIEQLIGNRKKTTARR